MKKEETLKRKNKGTGLVMRKHDWIKTRLYIYKINNQLTCWSTACQSSPPTYTEWMPSITVFPAPCTSAASDNATDRACPVSVLGLSGVWTPFLRGDEISGRSAMRLLTRSSKWSIRVRMPVKSPFVGRWATGTATPCSGPRNLQAACSLRAVQFWQGFSRLHFSLGARQQS
jgi:hypothetical protein